MTQPTQSWRRRVMLFFISQCITLFGSQIVQMAIVWHVTLATGSGVWVAAFSVCSYLPQFFISFIGGVWADRYSRKRLIITADVLIASVTFAMLLIMPYITDDAWLLSALLIMSVIRSAGAGIQHPAVNAVIPQLVPEESLFIVWKGETPVGTACGYLTPEAGKGTLHMVSVLASESGHALGQLVCAKAIEWLLAQNPPVIDLTTDDFRMPAVITYLRLGYLPVIDDEEMFDRWQQMFARLNVSEKRAFRSLASAEPEEIL